MTLEAIADTADITKHDTVLEIGPGLGSLTRVLSERAGRVIAVELDKKLARLLALQPPGNNIEVIEADILKFDFGELPPDYKLVANIPYYLTSHLLRILSESSNPPKSATLLMQQEVAERVVAQPGEMSLLAVTTQYYWHVGLGPVVSAKLFTPPPKVDSQVLLLERRPEPLFPGTDTKRFFQIVRAGFSQRRKKLRGSLSGGLRISKEQADELLEKAGIDGNLRAQSLSLDDWYKIHLAYGNLGLS